MRLDNRIGKREAIYFILIVVINKIILNLPKLIIKDTSTGAIVNLLVTGLLAILLTLFISYLFKKFQNHDIIDVAEYVGGNFFKTILGIAYIIFFSIIICTVLLKFISIIKVIYFPKAPYIYIFLFFMTGISIANFFGKRPILKTNALILPLIIFSLIIVFFGISNHVDINRLFPIFGNSFQNTFITGLSNIYAFGGITYLMFLMPLLKDKKDFKKVAIISIICTLFFLLFITTILLLTFPFILESEELISSYLLVRVLEFGEFFQRTDALFIFLWILSAFSYLSISLMFILNILGKITKLNDSKQLSFSIGSILFSIVLLLNNQYILNTLDGPIYKYFILILVFGISTGILVLANIKKFIKSTKLFKNTKHKISSIKINSSTKIYKSN